MPIDHVARLQPFHVWQNAFTPAELDSIEALGDRLSYVHGVLAAGRARPDYDLRVTRQAVMEMGPESVWLYQRLEQVMRALNHQTYQFDLMGFAEPFAYMVYDAAEGGHLGWHVDDGDQLPSPRKLSATLQLSSGDAHEGGDLEIFGTHKIEVAPRRRGDLIIFPSFVLHRVTPMRAGTRKALIIWSTGPYFR